MPFPHTRIIGLGNPLMGDDGLGIVAIERLQQRKLPPEIELIDAGCGGLSLLPLLETCRLAIIIDAAEFGATAGSIKILTNTELGRIPPTNTRPTSHQPRLADILHFCNLLDQLPQLKLFCVQVANVSLGTDLSPQVEAIIPALLDAVLQSAIPE